MDAPKAFSWWWPQHEVAQILMASWLGLCFLASSITNQSFIDGGIGAGLWYLLILGGRWVFLHATRQAPSQLEARAAQANQGTFGAST